MALPILNTQTFELNIPSTDEKIKYRPFLVKEEKILLQAQEGSGDEVTDAILQIVDNCTFGKINVEQLPSFDIEYIFLKIRSKSVGEKVKLNLSFPGDEKTKVQTEVDLSKIIVEMDDDHTNQISLTDNVSVIMRYPTVKTFQGMDLTKFTADDTISLTDTFAFIFCSLKKYLRSLHLVQLPFSYIHITIFECGWGATPKHFFVYVLADAY